MNSKQGKNKIPKKVTKSATDIFSIARSSVQKLSENNPLVLASSTAFFTTFSLAPITFILITFFGVIVKDGVVRKEILLKIRGAFGQQTADTVSNVLQNLQSLGEKWYVSIIGLAILIFISTTLLLVVQNSINQIWGIKQKPEKHLQRVIKDRLISLLVIMASGLLIMISFLIQASLAFIGKYVIDIFPNLNLTLFELLNELVSFLIVVVWFAVIYRFLPSAKLNWKALWVGSLVTSLLFSVGRFLLVRFLPATNITSIYGASGSLVLILLFVFYSALIFYLGAAFTKVYAERRGIKFLPKPYAVRFKTVEVD